MPFRLGTNRIGRLVVGEIGGFDADYQAILDYATIEGYTLPSEGQQTLQNTLVTSLKSAGDQAGNGISPTTNLPILFVPNLNGIYLCF